MTASKTLGDWLHESGWVQALVQTDITTVGTADSYLKASHATRARCEHKVTAAALYILWHCAYKHRRAMRDGDPLEFKQWQEQKEEGCPKFQDWSTVMAMELSLLAYVHSLREADFSACLDSLTELTPWFSLLAITIMPAGYQLISEICLSLQLDTQRLRRKLMLVTSQFKQQNECSHPFPSIKHTNKTMPALRVMEGQLVSQTTQMLYGGGWLLALWLLG